MPSHEPAPGYQRQRSPTGPSALRVLAIVGAALVTVAVVVVATVLVTLATMAPRNQAAPPTVYLPAPPPILSPWRPVATSGPTEATTTPHTPTNSPTTPRTSAQTAARRAPGRGTGSAGRPFIEADRLPYPECQGIPVSDLPGSCLCGGGTDGLNDICP